MGLDFATIAGRISTDSLEAELVRAEVAIGRLRSLQAALVAEADRRQVPMADGCRTLAEHRAWDGGDDTGNLTTVCWFHHHRVIHGMGYRIDPRSPAQRRRLIPPGADPP